ncbi:MAG: glycosyltransferase family 2 protein [Gammaproteobacteria bacterium]|nr:glycosyltransferase family 2 protein [Gammaproteobacteria bacterium]
MYKITVIIPTFNRVQTIPRAIESVLSQSITVDEIIIIDDGSTDGTEEMIRQRYPAVKYIYQLNKGVSAARNRAIAESRNDWLAFLDDDDEWMPHKLEKQIQLLQNSPDIKLCHTEERWVRNGVRVNQMNKHQKSGGWIYQKCLPLCAISPSSVVMHKSLFDDVGTFREDLPACEDYDMWLKICATNPVAYVETECLIKYGGHDDQLSAKHWGMDRFRIDALINILNTGRLNDEDKGATQKILRKKITVFMKGAAKRNKAEEVKKYESILTELDLADNK